jgi:hypothetical protein
MTVKTCIMAPNRCLGWLSLSLLALLLWGCSTTRPEPFAEPGEERLVWDTQRLWEALKRGNADTLYEYLPSVIQQTCSLRSFRELVPLALADLPAPLRESSIELEDIAISGERATFTRVFLVDGVETDRDQQTAVWDHGRWRDPDVDLSCN